MNDIYFDNSATTMIDKEVLSYMDEFSIKYYANPSAMHRFGYLVEEEIKKATGSFSEIINANPKEIIWTSGGTESNNQAIISYVNVHSKTGNRIITTSFEHPSVLRAFEYLASVGYDVKYLSVDNRGQINLNELESLITKETLLVSIMYVNNEIGSVQNINEVGKLIKNKNSNTAFHVDFVQGFGKYRIDCKNSKIDLLSISAHKFHGPKGIGVLYKNNDIRIMPLLFGGGQQNDLRSGTLNTVGIIGTSFAAKQIYDNFDTYVDKLTNLRDYLIEKLLKLNDKYGIIHLNTMISPDFAPHIVSVAFKGIRSEVMLHALEDKGIYVSAGSACSSHSKKISNTLISIGLNKELADSTIRISFGKYNTKSEIDILISELDNLIKVLSLKDRR